MLNRFSRRSFLTASCGALLLRAKDEGMVESIRTPQGGLQPQAVVDAEGAVHLIYLYGDPGATDIGYVRKGPQDSHFSDPLRVNSAPGSAIALGSVRGAHLALGKAGRVHVAWNGSSTAQPKGPGHSAPMLYTRLNDAGDGFEPQRNGITTASGLDGGGTLAADGQGNVFLAWHAPSQQNGLPMEGEGHRRVWLARSTDEGKTFAGEKPISPTGLGACGCCGMGALADREGNLYLLYRSARETIHRDMFLLVSRDRGASFQAVALHPWEIGACPMSTVSLAYANGRVLVAWETAKQVYFAPIAAHTLKIGTITAAPGKGVNRKHPTIAAAQDGQMLLAWTEGTGWKKGGSLTWQRFDSDGHSLGAQGASSEIAAWNFGTAVPTQGRFLLIA